MTGDAPGTTVAPPVQGGKTATGTTAAEWREAGAAQQFLAPRPIELEQIVENDQHRADRYRGIGYVEGWEVVIFVMHAYEVDDVAEQHAIDHVAEGAAE